MRTIDVALGERGYPIHIGAGLLTRAGELLAPAFARPRAIVVTNPVVAARYLEPLRSSLQASGIASEAILVPDGEAHKSLATLDDVLTRLLQSKAERSTTLVALGGGVVGDLAGFAAAVYQRGMPFIQVPTTLLAQVDSSVGGKTAVNHPLGKNMIGAFHQPRAVLIDTHCLRHAARARVLRRTRRGDQVRRDPRRRVLLVARGQPGRACVARDDDALAHAIGESCRIKAEIVAADERETGERALLNLGHTFGHAIEAGLGYGEWLHGEAVAAGMVLAAQTSARLGLLPTADVARLSALIARAGLPVAAPALGFDRWLELMGRDKKVEGGALRFVLLDALGRARVRAACRPPTSSDLIR